MRMKLFGGAYLDERSASFYAGNPVAIQNQQLYTLLHRKHNRKRQFAIKAHQAVLVTCRSTQR